MAGSVGWPIGAAPTGALEGVAGGAGWVLVGEWTVVCCPGTITGCADDVMASYQTECKVRHSQETVSNGRTKQETQVCSLKRETTFEAEAINCCMS